MPSRQFRYATLLRVRQLQEDMAAQTLAEVRRQMRFVEKRRASIVDEQRHVLDAAADATKSLSGGFHAASIEPFFQYERHLSRMATEQEAALAALSELEQQRRNEVIEASKRKRIMELLKERHRREYGAYVTKETQKVSDETASNRAARKGPKS
jgi:flagellar FliJ protein